MIIRNQELILKQLDTQELILSKLDAILHLQQLKFPVYDVSVLLLGETIHQSREHQHLLETRRVSFGSCVSAKIKQGENHRLKISPQVPVLPGAWVVVIGQVFIRSVIIGNHSQEYFLSSGPVCKLLEEILPGVEVLIELEGR